jgi:hypothetical protein
VNTDRNWSSENRYQDSAPENSKNPGTARSVQSGIVPAWSVPPGLIDPDRQTVPPEPSAEEAGQENRDIDRPAEPADRYEDMAWPGVAQPARWFLRAPTRLGQGGPTGAFPAPHREPDGSWSTMPPPAPPAPEPVGPVPAQHGRAGGPGFQPHPTGEIAPDLSPWQRSQRQWQGVGAQWQPAATGTLADEPSHAQQAPHSPQPSPHVPGPQVWVPRPRACDAEESLPLSAPVLTDTDPEHDDLDFQDEWADDQPPIWERPGNLVPPP